MAVDNRTLTKFANILATLILGAGIVIYAINNLGNRYFWSDEASSFLTSLGFPPPGQFVGSLADSWAANQSHVEPGLFNWLERLWAQGFGTEIETLRTLPFTFFLVYITSILLLSRFVGAPWFLGCAAASVMLLENITPYYMVEFRPSIAGLAASVVLPLMAIWLTTRKSSVRGLIFFIPTFFVFASLQYTTFPIVIGMAGILVVASFRATDRTSRIAYWVVAVGSLMWLPLVYVLLKGNPFDLAGGDSFGNIPEVYIPNMPFDEAFRTVFTNFFSLTALPRTFFLVLIPLIWMFRKFPRPSREPSPGSWSVNALWVTVFLGTTSSAAAGILGFLPWILGTRWSITEVGLIALSVVGLVGVITQSRFFARQKVRLLLLLLSLLVCFAGAYRLSTYERIPGFNWNSALETILISQPNGALIDNWTYPELRYWVEYSGQYDRYRDAWIEQGVEIAGADNKADTQDIEAFVASNSDVLVLRSESLLEGVDIPSNFRIERVDAWSADDTPTSDGPILLVRE